MIPGDPFSFVVLRQAIDGSAATGKTSANFTVQGFRDGAAAALTVTSVTEGATYGPSGNQWRAYAFLIAALPSTAGFDQIHLFADNTDAVWPDAFGGEVESYDLASMAALFLTAQGVPAVQSAADSSLGDIVDEDSYLSPVLTMPAGKLSPFGITDISAAGLTVQAAVKATPGGTGYPITVTIVSGPALEFRIGWDDQPFPELGTSESAAWYIDVQVVKTGPPQQIITTNRYSFTQVWQRDTRPDV